MELSWVSYTKLGFLYQELKQFGDGHVSSPGSYRQRLLGQLQVLFVIEVNFNYVYPIHKSDTLKNFKFVFLISGPVHMIPGHLIAPRQLTDPGVNFATMIRKQCEEK